MVPSQRLGLGSGGYGLLLAASLIYAAALTALVLVPNTAVVLVLLLPTGVAWMAVLSSMNAAIQLFLPAWVRACGLSVYQIVFFGAQAAGALLWGLMAGPLGLVGTFLLAAAVLVAGAVTIRLWPLSDTRKGYDHMPPPHTSRHDILKTQQ